MILEASVSWIDRLKPRFGAAKQKPAVSALNGAGGPPTPATRAGRAAAKAARAAGFPRFHATAGDQLDPFSADEFGVVRLKLRNAYTPAQPITDRWMFAGRIDILTMAIRAIEDERLHTIIYGQRGIGKTSLLHVLTQAAREARYLVAYVSCGADATFDETFRSVAAEIPLRFHEAYGPTSSQAEKGATVADLLPSVGVSPRLASDLCTKVAGTRVLVVLDEFDRCESTEFRRSVAEFLKNLSDRSVRVQLVIAGVASNLEELLEPGAMIQRSVVALEVPKMTTEEIGQLVRNGQAVSGLTFDEAAMTTLVAAANGLPYLASLLCQHAGLSALADARLTVGESDVLAAITEALHEMKGRVPRRALAEIARCMRDGAYDVLGPLSGVAQLSNGQFSANDIAAAFPGVTDGAARSLVDRLAESGILIERRIDEFGDHFRFVDQNVLPYLWLLSAQAQFAARSTPRAATLSPSTDDRARV
jgi:Cdc6-like AAA superfamily ATPase